MGSQRLGHNWVTFYYYYIITESEGYSGIYLKNKIFFFFTDLSLLGEENSKNVLNIYSIYLTLKSLLFQSLMLFRVWERTFLMVAVSEDTFYVFMIILL